ncbi:UNVERIFIED_CONTAM: hypothetical protein FKN15_006007 [Acipenser sinensis]
MGMYSSIFSSCLLFLAFSQDVLKRCTEVKGTKVYNTSDNTLHAYVDDENEVLYGSYLAHRYHPCADLGGAKMNTRCPPKRVPSAARCFTHCGLTMQPPQSYSVGGQRSSGQLTGKPAGARPDYRGRWCAEYVFFSSQRALCVHGLLANNGKQNHGEYQMFGKRVFRSFLPPRWFSLPTSTSRTSSASKKADLRKQQSIIL